MYGDQQLIANIVSTILIGIGGIIVGIVVFLILRQFWCWYWKINEALRVFNEMLTNLEDISGVLLRFQSESALRGKDLGKITESLQRIERLQKRSDREEHNTKEVETLKENDPELASPLSELDPKEKIKCSRCGSLNSNKVSRCSSCGAWL